MPIDVTRIKYDVLAFLPGGGTLPLRGAILGLQWEEEPTDLAVRLQCVLPNLKTKFGRLHSILALGLKLGLLADWGQGWRPIFLGTVVEWQYSEETVGQLTLTAYDDLWWLARSQDEYLWTEGERGINMLRQLFNDYSIPTGIIEGPNVSMPKMTPRGRLADIVFTVLTEAFHRPGGLEYLVRCRVDETGKNVVDVVRPGRNTPVYHVRAGQNVAAFTDQHSITDLVTEVHVIGEASQESAGAPVESTPAGAPVRGSINTVKQSPLRAFWKLRAVVKGSSNDTPAVLEEKANDILEEHGEPRRIRTVTVPDLPFIRRGDRIVVTAGTMDTVEAIITGVQHDADSRTMTLTFDSSGTFKYRQKRGETKDSTKSYAPVETIPAGAAR